MIKRHVLTMHGNDAKHVVNNNNTVSCDDDESTRTFWKYIHLILFVESFSYDVESWGLTRKTITLTTTRRRKKCKEA
jgi:hypothetical protein